MTIDIGAYTPIVNRRFLDGDIFPIREWQSKRNSRVMTR